MTMQISSQNQQFLDAAVASGTFATRDAAIDRAISMLRERQEAISRILAHAVVLPELPTVLEKLTNGNIVVRGHRISLHLILDRYFAGGDEHELSDRFETLTAEEITGVLAFVRTHEDTMRAYHKQEQRIESLMLDESHRGPSLEEFRERWKQKFGSPYVSPCP